MTSTIYIESIDLIRHKRQSVLAFLTSTRPIFNCSIIPCLSRESDRWATLASAKKSFRVADCLHVFALSDTLQFAPKLDFPYDYSYDFSEEDRGIEKKVLAHFRDKKYFSTTLRKSTIGVSPRMANPVANLLSSVKTLEELSLAANGHTEDQVILTPFQNLTRLRKLNIFGSYRDKDLGGMFSSAGDNDSVIPTPVCNSLQELSINANGPSFSFGWLPNLANTLTKLKITRGSLFDSFKIENNLVENLHCLINLKSLELSHIDFEAVFQTNTDEDEDDEQQSSSRQKYFEKVFPSSSLQSLTLQSCKIRTLSFLKELAAHNKLEALEISYAPWDMLPFAEFQFFEHFPSSSLRSIKFPARGFTTHQQIKGPITDKTLAFLAHLDSLEVLHLEGNPISDEGFRQHLSRLNNLKVLDISYCRTLSVAGGLKYLPLHSIEELNLSMTNIDASDVEDCLVKLDKLSVLRIDSCHKLSDIDLRFFFDNAQCLSVLKHLQLSNISSESSDDPVSSLWSKEENADDDDACGGLFGFDEPSNTTNDDDDNEDQSTCSSALPLCPSLEILDLHRNRVTDKCIESIFKTLVDPKKLRVLNFHGSKVQRAKLTDDALRTISISDATSLTTVVLNENYGITAEGMEEYLSKMTWLKKIVVDNELYSCGSGEEKIDADLFGDHVLMS